MTTIDLEQEVLELEHRADLLQRRKLALEIIEQHDPKEEWNKIILISASEFDVEGNMDDFKGPNRSQGLADARQIAMALIRELYGVSMVRVGTFFNRDHGTVLHAIRAVESKKTDPKYSHKLSRIRERVMCEQLPRIANRQSVTSVSLVNGTRGYS